MKIKEWVADNIGYRFSGCAYARHHNRIFESIRKLIPQEFLHRNISDFGCGDGTNTLRIKNIFQAKSIIGYERNPHLIKRASVKGLRIKQLDFEKEIPGGEMATFSFALHHVRNEDKIRVLKEVAENYKYIFLLEPIKDLYHALFDAGYPLKKERWIKVFDEALRDYEVHQQGNNLIVFSVIKPEK